jgi:hypothetical protein
MHPRIRGGEKVIDEEEEWEEEDWEEEDWEDEE